VGHRELDERSIRCLKKAADSCGLGFGIGDIVGGWSEFNRVYRATPALVFVKGGDVGIPANLEEHVKSAWATEPDCFRDYANQSGVPNRDKTQAIHRAYLPDPNDTRSGR